MHEWLFNSSGALLYFKLVFTCRRQVCAQINNYYNTYNTVLCIMLCIDNKITIRYYLPEHMCIMYIILTLYFFFDFFLDFDFLIFFWISFYPVTYVALLSLAGLLITDFISWFSTLKLVYMVIFMFIA